MPILAPKPSRGTPFRQIKLSAGSRRTPQGDWMPQKKANLPDRVMDDAYDDVASLEGIQFVAESA